MDKPKRYSGYVDEWWQEALKGFGWPEEGGSRDLGTIEELYQVFKARLIRELLVDVHGTPNYGRILSREDELNE